MTSAPAKKAAPKSTPSKAAAKASPAKANQAKAAKANEVKEAKAEGNKIIVIAGAENDIRKDIAALVVAEGAGLLEFVHKQADLEDVFINLTKS